MDASTSSIIPKPRTMLPRKIQWPEAPSVIQRFSIPPSIMYYIAKNPTSSKQYSKLAQTCKYFFEKLPLLVVADIYGLTTICPNKNCIGNDSCCVDIGDVNPEKLQSRFWFTNALYLFKNNVPQIFYSQIYRCENIKLEISDMDIEFDDFKVITTTAKHVYLEQTRMVYGDGSMVMLEDILGAIPNVKHFEYTFIHDYPAATKATLKNISKLINLGSLRSIILCCIPEIFEIEDIVTFYKAHPTTTLFFHFCNTISDGYKLQLDSLVDTVIEKNMNHCVIDYHDQDEEKYTIMEDRSYSRNA